MTPRALRRVMLLAAALVASAVALLIEFGDLFESTELSSVDARFEIRGEREAPEDIVFIAIDDVSFNELGERWPFSRFTFARALDRIAPDKPRVIVYDVQFTEASDDEEADNELILASADAGNVVFSTTEVEPGGATNVFGGEEGQEIARATVGNGLLPQDPGGVLRRLNRDVNGIPALSVAAAEEAFGKPIRFEGSRWIDFSGPPGTIRTVSFSRVALERLGDRALPKGFFKDKIVVIGASAPTLQDLHPTSWPGPDMPGPEVHANAIDTLRRGAPLQSASGLVAGLLAFALSLVAPLAGLRLRALPVLGISLTAAVAYLVIVQLAFNAGTVLPVLAPLVGLALAAIGALIAYYVTESVERAQVRDLFSRFVPDSVVNEVLERADRSDPRLGGVRLVSTVMFSDLRGFTTFAEERDPEEVIEVLNRYLTAMSDAILDHGGTLVAYMGDGIMAVFGAPIGSDDHADRALAAGREMLGRMQDFNAWMRERGYGDGFKMGIGLNTGGVMSGNVGSARRLEYTAIGDTTNTAARLEGMTKGTPYQLFLSGTTYDALHSPPEDLELVGEREVRGRAGRMTIWALGTHAAVPSEST